MPIIITIIISVVLAAGDYNFAGAYRDFTSSLKKRFPQSREAYFCPASFSPTFCWGYAYYLNKYYPQSINIKIGQAFDKAENPLYIVPKEPVFGPSFYEACVDYAQRLGYNMNLIGNFYYKSHTILHNRRFHAGFYSHDWGLLPFYLSFKKVPLETFDIYQITGATH